MTLADLKSGYSLPWNKTHTITFNKEQRKSLETGLSSFTSSLKSISDTTTGHKGTGTISDTITGHKGTESQLSDGDFPLNGSSEGLKKCFDSFKISALSVILISIIVIAVSVTSIMRDCKRYQNRSVQEKSASRNEKVALESDPDVVKDVLKRDVLSSNLNNDAVESV